MLATPPSRFFALIIIAGMLAASAPLSATALPTPGLFCEEALATTGRLFPEAEMTNDFVGFEEAECGLEALDRARPDRIEILTVASSVGWKNQNTGVIDQFPVYVVEVTNEASSVPFAEKQKLIFQLSIHGNEKGGREGGLRVIEDLVSGIGIAKEDPTLIERLDFQVFIFMFTNPDGWRHEELDYRANNADYFAVNGVETQNFVRVNGNGADMNRDWPTAGWNHEGYTAMSEPEVIGAVAYLRNLTNIARASDIHGMLHPADGTAAKEILSGDPDAQKLADFEDHKGHFVLTMLPAGRQSPTEMLATTSLAELIKVRLNADPFFAEWQNLPSTGGAWGGEFNDWGTVWDTIDYTDSGLPSDWFAQDTGLNAPGVDFELAYSHVTFDNYYPGLAQRANSYHVQTVRVIVKAFSDHAAAEYTLAVETGGARTGYLYNPAVVTPLVVDGKVNLTGWAAENKADDAMDYAHRTFTARPNEYFTDLAKVARAAGAKGVIEAVNAGEIDADRLARFDNFVIAGDAWATIKNNAVARAALKSWTEAGGNLVLTDSGLELLEGLGVADSGSVKNYTTYAPATNFVSQDHPLAQGVRGLARQLYEPVPLGFTLRGGGNSPVWYVSPDGFKGDIVGVAGATPDPSKVNFGRADVGAGQVVFIGALLPTPSQASYHPYGLDAYATTYTGNQLLLNALGFREGHESSPITLENFRRAPETVNATEAAPEPAPVPGPGVVGLLGAALVAVALVGGSRRARGK